ncbi:sulfotransferase [Streptomyces sp. NBC_00481]|uniref:sulfotransferase n=1 Tax=unclassified Streptomyces TaxID=2593676 RepID=UPI002DDC200D|nr:MULTISPECIES: sulfotransferase [unclassified Streptomyces]WRZ00396.1 sulfotransferase [Streptomyces sp. NBC_00481]
MSSPVFVVSTGRCGSTLLSEILHDHPQVLGVSELFSLLRAEPRFTGEESGERFWERLSEMAPVVDALVREGVDVPELRYPYGPSGGGRFDPATGVPGLCHMTLPMLTDSPDLLHDALAAEVPHWPSRPVPEQYRHLFDLLAARFAHPVVVERTGGSLEYVADLHEAFPDARFVYLGRDAADTALSMSRHALCRLRVLYEEALRILGVSSLDELGPEHEPVRDLALGPLRLPFGQGRLMGRDIPLTLFGRWWSETTRSGTAVLAQLPPGTWTALRYEDLVHRPEQELTELAGFLGLPAPASWLTRAATRADTSRTGASRRLPPAELAALDEACAPGAEADAALRALLTARRAAA